MKWFKFYGQDYLTDPKILSLSASERSCLVTLLSYGSINDDGEIKYLSEEQLMIQSGIKLNTEEWKLTTGVLTKFKEMNIISIDNNILILLNWQKRQDSNLTTYERVKKYRNNLKKSSNKGVEKQKKKETNVINDNAMITQESNTNVINDNAMITLEENRIEENRIEYGEINNSPKNINKSFFDKKEQYEILLNEFSKNNDVETVEKEFEKFWLYWSEKNSTGKKQKWELQPTFDVKRRLFTWLSRKNEWLKKYKNNGRGLA